MRPSPLVALLSLALGAAGTACGGDLWQPQDTGVSGASSFSTVWAFAADDVWIGGTQVVHWDGSAFTVRSPSGGGGVAQLWGAAPNDLWAVDGGSVLRWQGAAWARVPLGITLSGGPQRIFGFSSSDLWVGTDINGEMVHWNGATWTRTISQTIEVRGIWGAAPNDVWAVGLGGFSHWNGGAWAKIDVPAAVDVQAVWGFGARDVWAVGLFQTLVHWDGAAWTATPIEEDHIAVWGASPSDVWATGENGEVSHFDGATWSTSQTGFARYLAAVHGASGRDVWIVGYDRRALAPLVFRYSP